MINRRRGLMNKTQAGIKIVLYQDGDISEVLGSIVNAGLKQQATYNQVSIENTYLKYYNTSTGATAAVKGGNSFASTLALPASYIGKTLHVKGQHKNSASSAEDRATAVIAESISSASTFGDAYGTYIYKTEVLGQHASFADFEISLSISMAGYLSLIGRKNAAGAVEIRFKEVWVE